MSYNIAVDEYINKAQPFAQPILHHLRKLVHEACPDVDEKIKWGMPSFEYFGLMCGFAAFKQHCTFGFWRAALMKDKMLMNNAKSEVAMGHLGRITTLNDLPDDKKIKAYIKEAMKLNKDGIKIIKTKPSAVQELIIPDELARQLKKNVKCLKIFENFSITNKRDYVDWISEAKTEATKNKRIQQSLEWISEGKPRNWKYMKQHNN